MIRFIGFETKGCAQALDVLSPSIPLLKKSNLALISLRTKASVQELSVRPKFSPV